MKNDVHMKQPWLLFASPFILLTLIFFGLAFFRDDGHYALWAVPFFLVLATMYILSPQINWWWFKKNPPELNPGTKNFLDNYAAYYKKLSPELKMRFRQRVAMFIIGNEFIRPVHKDNPDAAALRNNVPEDLKAAVASNFTQIHFGKPEILPKKFEHYILYPHPFPTTQFPVLHNSEIYEADGVVLFAADPLMQSLSQPQNYFNIGLYEMARIFKYNNTSIDLPKSLEKDLEKISQMSKSKIESIVGLSDLDNFAIATHHFFVFPKMFSVLLPDIYQLFCNLFNQNPINEQHPIIVI